MTNNIMTFWPHSDKVPYKSQIAGLEWLEKQDKKFLLLEGPVGCGKSAIAVAYSSFLNQPRGDSYILTPQRILQEQYEFSFRKELLFSLYGKNNYTCNNKNTTCGIGCKTKPSCDVCTYKIALSNAKTSSNLVLNYKLALLHFAYLPFLGKRKLMVLDECHNLESELIEFDSLEITNQHCKKYGIDYRQHTDLVEAFSWVVDTYQPRLIDIFYDMQESVASLENKKTLTPDDIEFINEFESIERRIKSTEILLEHSDDDITKKYILLNDKMSYFKFKKIFAKDQFKRLIEPKAERILFMSATIPDPIAYCKDLGIDQKEVAFLRLDSEFEREKRPVFFMPVMKMNAQWTNDDNSINRNKMLETIIGLTDMHKDHSGIIHSGNFEVTKWLVKNLNNKIPQKIYHHIPSDYEQNDRNDVINKFSNSKKPALLISPSITEGLDLKDDKARFALFVKIPFGYLGDQWIKTRMNISKEWYQRMALIDVLQGCGRVVRSKYDWGNVYILDSSWGYLLTQTVNKIPKWWLDAYCEYDD